LKLAYQKRCQAI